ncbi:MAG: SpoIIE family protein phosphatase [Bryobacteraceae bacterium]|jgi:sigma-B regulation protein RsbU (phosphoserine phosphatase)
MRKGLGSAWRRLGFVEKAFLVVLAVWLALYFSGISSLGQSLAGLAAFFLGLAGLFRVARRGMRKAIWRLRNRLIAAYLFIAVVPIVLILTLVGIAGWWVIGQMAVYLVNTELTHREQALLNQAEAQASHPSRDPSASMSRFAFMTRRSFPNFEVLVTGEQELRVPPESTLNHPSSEWKQASGLILKQEGKSQRLYAWAHVPTNSGHVPPSLEQVTVLAPITQDLLSSLVSGLGDVNYVPLHESSLVVVPGQTHKSHIPAARNGLDFPLTGFYPIEVPTWDSPNARRQLVLTVSTRISAVLGTVFQELNWAETALYGLLVVGVLFFIVEMASLVAGVQLSRSITGAVHEIYEGTQHVKDGDFSYRIPVKGNDQLAELGNSFNTMTENLGRLIIVAKEKERLESELAIAREVQNQLFPKDVPFTRTLELKGVCHPARMVSGDYYDFMALPNDSLAFAIGDVAGKGISAALLMATIQSTMRTQLSGSNGSWQHHSPAYMVANLNRLLFATTAPEKYATFYFAMYDDAQHALTYTNAGHLSPMLLRDGNLSLLEPTGTVVGAFASATYEEKTISLEHGDMLVAYTDGIVEPENAYGEMFGEERLQELLTKYARTDSSEIIARAMEAVVEWTGEGELQDDMTMVVARRI